MNYSHFDLDEIERGVRAMFEECRKLPPPQDKDEAFVFHWQNRTEEIRVQSMRLMLQMEMEGLQPIEVAGLMGILAADMVQDLFGSVDKATMGPCSLAMLQMFSRHLKACLVNHIQDGKPDAEFEFNPVQGGRA